MRFINLKYILLVFIMSLQLIRQQTVEVLSEKNLTLAEIILFGSRAKSTHSKGSDFDIIVVLENNLSIPDKMSLTKIIRERLAKQLIDIDIIIKSASELVIDRSKKWTIVYQALKEGIII